MSSFENLTGACLVGSTLIFSPLLRSWYNRWGAGVTEVTQPLPGDELVPSPLLGYTRGKTIQAPAERIWPWLAQMGQGRVGLFVMERKMMLGIRERAERIQ